MWCTQIFHGESRDIWKCDACGYERHSIPYGIKAYFTCCKCGALNITNKLNKQLNK